MKKIKATAVVLYLLWAVSILFLPKNNIYVFTYITLFQFFIPGTLLSFAFGIFNRSITETILYGAVLSYIVFAVSQIPLLRYEVLWHSYLAALAVINIIILGVFLFKTKGISISDGFNAKRDELLALIIGIVIAVSFNHVNFRMDSTYYLKRIKDSYHSEKVEFTHQDLMLKEDGNLIREEKKFLIEDWKPYFNYLAMPLKWAKLDFRYAWFIYTKLFAFLSVLAVYILAKNLLGAPFGLAASALYLINVFPLAFYYGQPDIEIGVIFSEMAYPRILSENIFYFVFLNTSVNAFRTNENRHFILAGLVLLCLATQHLVAFTFGAANFIIFSLMVFVFTFSRHDNMQKAVGDLFKKYAAVFVFSMIFFMMIPDYFEKMASFLFSDNYQKYVDTEGYRNIVDRTFVQLTASVISKNNIMIFISVFLGLPLIIKAVREKREITSLFLLSNLIVYLILKFPLYNAAFHISGAAARRFDAVPLSFIVAAFIIYFLMKKVKIQRHVISYAAFTLALIVFILYGTDSYAARHRNMWNWGKPYFEMTAFLEYFQIDKIRRVQILTCQEIADDVYAHLDAYLFNYDKDAKQVRSLITEKIDDMFFYPQKDISAFNDFMAKNSVDYIVFPMEKSGYFPAEVKEKLLKESYPVYLKLDDFTEVYRDKYCSILKNKNS